MIKYYESLLLYEKSILVILEAVYSSRFIKVLRPYLDVTRVLTPGSCSTPARQEFLERSMLYIFTQQCCFYKHCSLI